MGPDPLDQDRPDPANGGQVFGAPEDRAAVARRHDGTRGRGPDPRQTVQLGLRRLVGIDRLTGLEPAAAQLLFGGRDLDGMGEVGKDGRGVGPACRARPGPQDPPRADPEQQERSPDQPSNLPLVHAG